MSAPNMLRVGTTETIFVESQGGTDDNVFVKITVLNHPTKDKTLASSNLTLTKENKFQGLGQITVKLYIII